MRQETSNRRMHNHSRFPIPHSPLGNKAAAPQRYGFTLVELLVVIAIIALLAGLLIAAAGPAVRKARQAVINTEIDQYNAAIEDFKNNVQSYPPNAQTDGLAPTPQRHLDNQRVLQNFKRFFNKAFPSHRESDELLEALVGLSPSSATVVPSNADQASNLPGGMNAAEAMVFWLGGFSDDPKYPISGAGGPSYSTSAAALGPAAVNQADPIDNRSWLLDVNIENIGPRDSDNFFPNDYARYITYLDPRDGATPRRINFWYLKAPNNTSPYIYFDASRGSGVDAAIDTPAATGGVTYTGPDADSLEQLKFVHAVKQLQDDASAVKPFRFANAGKFQIMHGGIDEAWGVMPMVNPTPQPIDRTNPNFSLWLIDPTSLPATNALFLHYPVGPWTLELADVQSNFVNNTLEDDQP